MKLLKYASLLILCGTIVISSFSLNTVKAAEINDTNTTNAGIVKMQQEVHKKYSNLKTVSTKTEYLKIQNVSKDPNVVKTKTTAYTESQYIKELQLEQSDVRVKTPDSQYGWIVLTLEIDNSYRNDGTYDIYGFFEWKKQPSFRNTDFIALGHDSNTVFHPETAEGVIEAYDGPLPTTEPDFYNPFTHNSSGFTYKGGDVGYGFSVHPANDYSEFSVPQGFISVNASEVNSQSDIVFQYEHEEIGISFSPSLALDGLSISVNAAAYYDPADIGTWY